MLKISERARWLTIRLRCSAGKQRISMATHADTPAAVPTLNEPKKPLPADMVTAVNLLEVSVNSEIEECALRHH